MIQQLFPGRTRQQVKLKYKKEEREHPLRLTEALTNRAKGKISNYCCYWKLRSCYCEFWHASKLWGNIFIIFLSDHSHFEQVIEQLQQFAAQAAQDAKEDDSASMIDEDLEELNPQYNVLFPALPCIFQNENFCLCVALHCFYSSTSFSVHLASKKSRIGIF